VKVLILQEKTLILSIKEGQNLDPGKKSIKVKTSNEYVPVESQVRKLNWKECEEESE
jgi:hypothetical protein